jgi:hypothetical protein
MSGKAILILERFQGLKSDKAGRRNPWSADWQGF